MIEALKPIMVGEWESFGALVVLPDDPRPSIPAREAISAEAMDAALPKVAALCGEGDSRALVSLWSMQHAFVVMAGGVAASLALGHDLPLHIDETRLILDEHGLPEAIVIPHEGGPRAHPDAFARFETLVDGHMAPVCAALAAYGRISQKVLWNNAANLYEYVLGQLEKRPDVAPQASARGRALVDQPTRPCGARNRFFAPVSYAVLPDEPIERWRTVCCLRHLLPSLDAYCANCPHRLKELRGKPPCATAAEM